MKLTAWGDTPYQILDIRDDNNDSRLGSVHATHPGWAAVCAVNQCRDPRHEGDDAKDATIALFAHWQRTHWRAGRVA